MKNLILVSGFTAAGKSFFIKKIQKDYQKYFPLLIKKKKSQKFIFTSFRKLKRYQKLNGKKFFFPKKTNLIFHMDIYEKDFTVLNNLISKSDNIFSIIIYTSKIIFIKRILIRILKLKKNFFYLFNKILFCLKTNNVYVLYESWILYLKTMNVNQHLIINSTYGNKKIIKFNYRYEKDIILKNLN